MSPDLRWYFYHGQRKGLEPREFAEHDVVCTTYETVFHDPNSTATLQAVPWFRIVLDEGMSSLDEDQDKLAEFVALGKRIIYEIVHSLFAQS